MISSRLPISKTELVLLCATVLVAAFLRFNHLDRAEFLWDQAEISKWALNMAQEREIAWIGPWSSTRLDTFPGAIWLLSIPYAISTSPIFATGFIAAINLTAVVSCYFLTRHWFGRTAALIATLLFAVAPWAVIYSRKVWHTELLPPFLPLYVATGWYAFVRGRRWAVLAHSLTLAALVQLHFTGLAFIPLTVLWALIFHRRLDWRAVPIGALLAVLTFVPYFINDAQNGWQNAHRFIEIMQQPAAMNTDVIHYTWIITTGLDLHWLVGPDRYPDFVAATPNARWLFALEGGLVIVGSVIALWRIGRRARAGLDDETAAALMTITWLAMPAVFLARSNTGVAPHYFTITLPAQFILIGWLISLAWRIHLPERESVSGRIARVGRGVLGALIVALAATQTYEIASLLQFVMTHDTPRGYGTPITYEIQAVQTATHVSQEMDGTEVILLSEGDDPRMFEMPAVADVLMYDHDIPHRSVDIRTTLVLPSNPSVYWATYDMTPGEALLATLTPELAEERILLRENARSFRFYYWPGGEPAIPNLSDRHMLPLPGGSRTWANGAQLVGYRLIGDLHPGGTIHWTLVWRVTQTPTEDVQYHWFNHLLDEQGQIRGQNDGQSLLSTYWRTGDTILNWFDLQIPSDALPGQYTMRVGMYTYPALENVLLLDTDGVPEGEWVKIESIQVTAP